MLPSHEPPSSKIPENQLVVVLASNNADQKTAYALSVAGVNVNETFIVSVGYLDVDLASDSAK
jgi:hypothetical protein